MWYSFFNRFLTRKPKVDAPIIILVPKQKEVELAKLPPMPQEIKKLSPEGIAFLAQNEGEILRPYLDSVKVPTIGIGCTYYEDGRRVKMTDPPITRERSRQLFQNVVKTYEIAVWSVTRDDLTQNEFNALVSFTYNVGVSGFKNSTLLRRINARNGRNSIAEAFMMWTLQKELRGRRQREVDYFLGKAIG